MEKETQKTLKTGTTTVALTCKDGVVLASDRRATMGYYIASKDIQKVYPISKHIGMTVAGVVGDAQALVRWMQMQARLYEAENKKPMSVNAAAVLLSNVLSNYKFNPYFIQLIVAGYDNRPEVYSIDMSGGYTKEKYTATGSGTTLAISVLENNYKDSMSVKEAAKIAARAVFTAMQRDAGSGEYVDVVVITKEGFKRLDKKEVLSYLNLN